MFLNFTIFPPPCSNLLTFAPDKSSCSLPMRRGRCRARLQAFFFDQESGTCKKFTFGGCGETQVVFCLSFTPKPVLGPVLSNLIYVLTQYF